MSKKVLWLLLLIIIVLAMVVWYFNQSKNEKASTPHTTMPDKAQETAKQSKTSTSNKTSTTKSKRSKPSTIQKETTEEEIIHQDVLLFETLSIEEAKLTTLPRNNVEPISAISITNHALSSLKAKDTLTLTDIEGDDYPLTIRSVRTYNDGTVTTTGVYSDEGLNYTTTITQAGGTSYITLSTPNGLYEIETSNDVGYVYDAKEIRRRLHRNHKDDMILYKPKIPKKEH